MSDDYFNEELGPEEDNLKIKVPVHDRAYNQAVRERHKQRQSSPERHKQRQSSPVTSKKAEISIGQSEVNGVGLKIGEAKHLAKIDTDNLENRLKNEYPEGCVILVRSNENSQIAGHYVYYHPEIGCISGGSESFSTEVRDREQSLNLSSSQAIRDYRRYHGGGATNIKERTSGIPLSDYLKTKFSDEQQSRVNFVSPEVFTAY